MDKISNAISALCDKKFVLIYDADNRERETDMVMCAEFVDYENVRTMRKDGGGLICVTLISEVRKKIGLPFLTELFERNRAFYPVLRYASATDIPYDTKSAFSVTINHRNTFTGITDRDRALTISEFGKFVNLACHNDNRTELLEYFGKRFRTPGHVHILNAAKNLIDERAGHTELATVLMIMANLTPCAAIVEMLDCDGNALSKTKAIEYSQKNGLVFLEGETIVHAWKRFKTMETV